MLFNNIYFKITFIFILLSFISSNITSQSDKGFPVKHYLGFNYGGTTGIGLGYRIDLSKVGFQVAGSPIFLTGNDVCYNTALTMTYFFKKSSKIDILGFLGNTINFSTLKNLPNPQPFAMIQNIGPLFTNINLFNGYNLGFGAGVNIHLVNGLIDLTAKLGYCVYNVDSNPVSSVGSELGVYYKFKN
jgi:hypothetical protein